MKPESYVINKMPPPVFFEQPKYTWQWCLDGKWTTMFNTTSAPCLFHRIAQRLILGIHWRPIK